MTLVIWVIFPMLIGAALATASIACAWSVRSISHCVVTSIVVAGIVWSEVNLFAMSRGAWPTFLPHVVLGISFFAVIVQAGQTIERTM